MNSTHNMKHVEESGENLHKVNNSKVDGLERKEKLFEHLFSKIVIDFHTFWLVHWKILSTENYKGKAFVLNKQWINRSVFIANHYIKI